MLADVDCFVALAGERPGTHVASLVVLVVAAKVWLHTPPNLMTDSSASSFS